LNWRNHYLDFKKEMVMARKKKTARKKTTRPDDVQQFARKLDYWAQKELTKPQQTLLRWLLSRCESRALEIMPKNVEKGGKKIEGRYLIEMKDVNEINIEEAVMDALAGLSPNPDELPTSGWMRGGPIWPRAGTWPRA
jgi:hypothetical protein